MNNSKPVDHVEALEARLGELEPLKHDKEGRPIYSRDDVLRLAEDIAADPGAHSVLEMRRTAPPRRAEPMDQASDLGLDGRRVVLPVVIGCAVLIGCVAALLVLAGIGGGP